MYLYWIMTFAVVVGVLVIAWICISRFFSAIQDVAEEESPKRFQTPQEGPGNFDM